MPAPDFGLGGFSKDGGMASGTIKLFITKKAYGFILPDGGGRDLFFHINHTERVDPRDLIAGARVEYSVGSNRRTQQPIATNVKLERKAGHGTTVPAQVGYEAEDDDVNGNTTAEQPPDQPWWQQAPARPRRRYPG